MVNNALKAINHMVGENRCPEHSNLPAIVDLFNKTPILELVESVIGKEMIHPIDHGQIALRYPTYQDPPPKPREHLDGLLRIRENIVQNFTALVGVYLTDVDTDYAGNFTVWPGSHRIYEEHLKEHGVESLFNGTPRLDLTEPHQIKGKAGDVILCHYQLGHAPAVNVHHNTRYACFFRVDHIDRRKDWKKPLTNIWMHWSGVKDMIEP